MKYGIITPSKRNRKRKIHYGILDFGVKGIKLNLFNKYSSCIFTHRNKELGKEILELLHKYFDLEDLNTKRCTGGKGMKRQNCIILREEILSHKS